MNAQERNQQYAKGLREMADFIDAHPELPLLGFAMAHGWISKYDDNAREKMAAAVRALVPCKKTYDDNKIAVRREFAGEVHIEFQLDRDAVCKRIVTWDCGDASLLKDLGLEELELRNEK